MCKTPLLFLTVFTEEFEFVENEIYLPLKSRPESIAFFNLYKKTKIIDWLKIKPIIIYTYLNKDRLNYL